MALLTTVARDQLEDEVIRLTRSGNHIILVDRNDDDTYTITSRRVEPVLHTRAAP